MTIAKLAYEIQNLWEEAEAWGGKSGALDQLHELVTDHAPQLAKMARLLELAEYIIDEDYKSADSKLSREFKDGYRALVEEIGE